MNQPEFTTTTDGFEVVSRQIKGHGHYEVTVATLALVTAYLAQYTYGQLISRMTKSLRINEGEKAYLTGLKRAELEIIAAEYPTIYMPGMVQALNLECEPTGRFWVARKDEEEAPVSEYVVDPANPTDDELAAAIQRGLADGTLLTSEAFLALAQAQDAAEEEQLVGRVAMIHAHGNAGDPSVALKVLDLEPGNTALLSTDYDFAMGQIADAENELAARASYAEWKQDEAAEDAHDTDDTAATSFATNPAESYLKSLAAELGTDVVSAYKVKVWVVCDDHAAGPYSTREVAERAMARFDCSYDHEIVESVAKPVTRWEAYKSSR